MTSITVEKNKSTIKLNSAFYPKEIIDMGINDFNEIDKISVNEKGEIILEDKKNIEEKTYEFCDYLLKIKHGGVSWH